VITPRAIVRLVGATVGLAALSAGSIAAAPLAAPASAATRLELQLTKVSPAAVNPEDPLVVTGTIRNPGTKTIKNVSVDLRLHGQPLDTRQEVDDWLSDGEVAYFDRTLAVTAKVANVPAGRSVRFTLTVPAGLMHLPIASSAFGPRGIALEARVADPSGSLSVNQSADPLDLLRSTIVWAPTDLVDQTKLSLLVPITTTEPTIAAGQPGSDFAASVLPGGRLQRVLKAGQDPAIGWAVDPAILASVQRLGTNGISREATGASADAIDDPTGTAATPSGANSSGTGSSGAKTPAAATATGSSGGVEAAKIAARTWLGQFESGQPGRTVLGLPFADTDLSSVLNTKKALTLLRHADSLGKAETVQVLGRPLDTTVAWPGDGKASTAALSALSRSGRTAVLLASGNQRPDPVVDYTPTGHSELRGSAGKTLDGLLYDEQLSTLATASGGTQAALNTQTLLAQLAAITMERPGDTRQVLAVMPRTWSPDPAGVQAMMTALHSAPWVSLSGLSTLRKATGPPRANPTYQKTAAKAQLPLGAITGALALSRDLDTFSSALTNPGPVLQPLQEQVASLLSVAWRSRREQLSTARQQVANNVDDLVDGVRLLVGAKKKLFTARKAPIQVTVENDTNYPVQVIVRLKPQSGQLTFEPHKVFTAPPNQQTTVPINARAIANGNVVVEAVLLSQDGKALGASHTFIVRVRPNWESRGMVVVGGFLGVLFIVGLLRGIRRRRPRVPPEAVPDVDDQAARRADQAAADQAAADQAAADQAAADQAADQAAAGETAGDEKADDQSDPANKAGEGVPFAEASLFTPNDARNTAWSSKSAFPRDFFPSDKFPSETLPKDPR
jgi:Family of unknown function (DUF6049)